MWVKPLAQPFDELKAAAKERVKAVATGLDEFLQAVAAQSVDGQPPGGDFGLAELEEKLLSLKRKVRTHPCFSPCAYCAAEAELWPDAAQVERDSKEEAAAVQRCRARVAHIEECTRESATQKPRRDPPSTRTSSGTRPCGSGYPSPRS